MKTVTTVDEVRRETAAARAAGRRIGFVPTMGSLHEGHFSLMDAAAADCDYVVVSIFVNPTQFGEGEDLDAYPRSLRADTDGCAARGVSLLFVPGVEEIYPDWPETGLTTVSVGDLTSFLCGRSRPGHFAGVCTVVTILLNIVRPDAAYFGEKDYQQLLVIRRMVRDLKIPVSVVGCPTVRAEDGLALSSRNAYLAPDDRRRAAVLYTSLREAAGRIRGGRTDPREIEAEIRDRILDAAPAAAIDYVSVCDPETLRPIVSVGGPALIALAVRVGNARLIDHLIVGERADSSGRRPGRAL